MEEKPTNGELAVMITSLTNEFRDKHEALSGDVKETKVQVTLTNGRVRKLEQWKFMLLGGFIVVDLVFIPIIVTWVLKMID